MPSYFPEGDAPLPGDDEARSLQKWNALLFAANGDQGPTWLGDSAPQPNDDPQRSLQKIVALLQ